MAQALKIHLVMDCLNTHRSEALVRLVAALEPEPIPLAAKGKVGILKSMADQPTENLIDQQYICQLDIFGQTMSGEEEIAMQPLLIGCVVLQYLLHNLSDPLFGLLGNQQQQHLLPVHIVQMVFNVVSHDFKAVFHGCDSVRARHFRNTLSVYPERGIENVSPLPTR